MSTLTAPPAPPELAALSFTRSGTDVGWPAGLAGVDPFGRFLWLQQGVHARGGIASEIGLEDVAAIPNGSTIFDKARTATVSPPSAQCCGRDFNELGGFV